MMTFERVEKYRKPHPMGFPHKAGDPYGWFHIPTKPGGPELRCMAAPASEQWQHVSVSLPHRCPTWEEMCKVKSLFWSEEACVVQYHPPKSDYVSFYEFCLHLWCYQGEMPRPPSICVGPLQKP